MKILVAADMEGITGVTTWDHVTPEHPEYARFRLVMTEEVNAAVRGAFEGGAGEVIVTDGHADGLNILVEKLDARARLNTGNGSPLSMVQGINGEISGVIFVGYHARAGSMNAVLAHTWSNSRVANVWLNDILVGEYGLNAAVCGHFGVPVIMISGDQTACAQARELLGPLVTVVVKQATGFFSAECLPPEITREQVFQAARSAVANLARKEGPKAFHLSTPVKVCVEFLVPHMADRVMRMPGATRLDGRRVEFTGKDMLDAYPGFRAAVALA